MLGLDRAPEVKTIRRKILLLAAAGGAGDWITAMAPETPLARSASLRKTARSVLYQPSGGADAFCLHVN